MEFWKLTYKYYNENEDECEGEAYFEDAEQAMSYVVDNMKQCEIYDFHIARRCTFIFRQEIILNKKGDK